jgi:two-component system, sensor histidine kinase and response regulator
MQRVLVIEDQDEVRNPILEMLESEGYEGLAAENGRQGVELAREHLPNLIISDIMMPELDGYGVLAELQQDPVTATIPFIFLTARTQPEDRRRGMLLGADDYLTKPFSFEELRNAIDIRLAKQSVLERGFQSKLEDLRANIALSLPHELRTPLTGVLGFSALLIESAGSMKPEEVQQIARLVYRSGLRLQRLTENFLLYAELEHVKAEAVDERLKLPEETCSVRTVILPAAQGEVESVQRPADLIMDIDHAEAAISAHHLRKITEELVNNALKFSTAGTPVEVNGRVRRRDQTYVLSVCDHGRGMSVREVAELGAYRQFGRQRHEQQGSGLGLAIVRSLAQIHAGSLIVESHIGKGSTFHVRLPLAPSAPDSPVDED